MTEAEIQQRKESYRRDVREFLAYRQAVAHLPQDIRRRLAMRVAENPYTLEEVQEALEFLVGLGHVEVKRAALGATKYYQATSAGVLAHERGDES